MLLYSTVNFDIFFEDLKSRFYAIFKHFVGEIYLKLKPISTIFKTILTIFWGFWVKISTKLTGLMYIVILTALGMLRKILENFFLSFYCFSAILSQKMWIKKNQVGFGSGNCNFFDICAKMNQMHKSLPGELWLATVS